jgi:hypothetical protein
MAAFQSAWKALCTECQTALAHGLFDDVAKRQLHNVTSSILHLSNAFMSITSRMDRKSYQNTVKDIFSGVSDEPELPHVCRDLQKTWTNKGTFPP